MGSKEGRSQQTRPTLYHYTVSNDLADIIQEGLVTNKNYHRSEDPTWQRYISSTPTRDMRRKTGKLSLFQYCDIMLELHDTVYTDYEVIQIDYTRFDAYPKGVQQHVLRNDYEVYQAIKTEQERERFFTGSRAFYLIEEETTIITQQLPVTYIAGLYLLEGKDRKEQEDIERLCATAQIHYKGAIPW